MDMPVEITSDSLIGINQHFRISAGPGAGKTYWLIKHIRNCLQSSEKLAKTRKIACITYTNTAVETILNRLGSSADKVEVSTIHSFLYMHLVKPYAFFLQQEFGLLAKELDGHDDTIFSNYSFLQDWKSRSGQQRIRDDKKIVLAFEDLKWKFEAGNLVVRPKYPQSIDGYNIKNDSYYLYKQMSWERGFVHHDDVLFFSYKLIEKHPFILQVLRSKFPYFFIDEFQDTSPIQLEIIKKIGQKETVIGIIGDPDQSIYKFQGADPTQFNSFSLPNISDYQIKDNRRSSNFIIDLLNKVRVSIQQNKIRNIHGVKPHLIIGPRNTAITEAIRLSSDINVYTLSRDNLTSNLMKRHLGGTNYSDDLLVKLANLDSPSQSNKYRSKVIGQCLKAVELAKLGRFKESIKHADGIFSRSMEKSVRTRKAMNIIIFLLSRYDSFKAGSFYDFYLLIKDNLVDVTNLISGNAKTFYQSNTYLQMAVCVKVTEDTSLHRTIHKAKGAEFKSVMLILQNENDLEFIKNPDLSNEEHRINYVAISRAIDNLFINVPSISTANQALLISHLDMSTVN